MKWFHKQICLGFLIVSFTVAFDASAEIRGTDTAIAESKAMVKTMKGGLVAFGRYPTKADFSAVICLGSLIDLSQPLDTMDGHFARTYNSTTTREEEDGRWLKSAFSVGWRQNWRPTCSDTLGDAALA